MIFKRIEYIWQSYFKEYEVFKFYNQQDEYVIGSDLPNGEYTRKGRYLYNQDKLRFKLKQYETVLFLSVKDGLIHNDIKPAILGKNYYDWYLNGILHCDTGPAVYHKPTIVWSEPIPLYFWFYIHNKDITLDVEKWMKENDIPSPEKWEDEHRIMFKLMFV